MLQRHRQCDGEDARASGHEAPSQRKLERLRWQAAQIRRGFKDKPQERAGARGSVVLSNRTDNDSAKMATAKGVIQGYTGVAVVDEPDRAPSPGAWHGQ